MEFIETNLAIVLLDIIGSTKFVQSVGPMKSAQWLQYHDRLARSLIYRFNGREIDRSDGFLLSFGRPIDALNFPLTFQETIPPKTRLGCRIGIHWGNIVEVKQAEIYTMTGAKSVELEGVAKNISARTMSICQPGQVLLTFEAMKAIKGRTNSFTPRGTRYACVGEYRFKGVKQTQIIYAVGSTIESLQPPPSGDKVKRIGGPNKIKSRIRDRKLKEWLVWFLVRYCWIMLFYMISTLIPIIIDPYARKMNELDDLFHWVDHIVYFIALFLGGIF